MDMHSHFRMIESAYEIINKIESQMVLVLLMLRFIGDRIGEENEI